LDLKLAKSAKKAKKIPKNSIRVSFKTKFYAEFGSVEKCAKKFTSSKSASNSVFFYTNIAFLKKEKKILSYIISFCKLYKANARTKRLKKTENFFYKCFLELNFATINGLGEQSC
jgi:hypothetical protein